MSEHQDDAGKLITAYCEPWSVRAGESVLLRASSHAPGPAELSLVRIICGDPTKAGPGFAEEVVASDLPASVDLTDQPLLPGSCGTVDLSGLTATSRLEIALDVLLTLPDEPQTLLSIHADEGGSVAALAAVGGVLSLHVGDTQLVLRSQPLASHRWYQVRCVIDVSTNSLQTSLSTGPSASPGRDLFETGQLDAAADIDLDAIQLGTLVLGGHINNGRPTGDFDGRIGQPSMQIDDQQLEGNCTKIWVGGPSSMLGRCSVMASCTSFLLEA